jgi:two-component system cell cycle response regulator
VLLRLLAERSSELGQHTSDVSVLAARTARTLGLHPDQIEAIRLAAELHDVGKAAIPDAILNKPGPLTDDEWEFIRRHTVIGERIVRAAPSLAHTAELVRSHHERHDGTGYPDALAGDEIPIGARVIAVSDSFDAMTTDRPYRRRLTFAEVVADLRRNAGRQFSPPVILALCRALLKEARGETRPRTMLRMLGRDYVEPQTLPTLELLIADLEAGVQTTAAEA